MKRLQMEGVFGKRRLWITVFCLAAVLMMGGAMAGSVLAQSPTRIVGLPFYTENGKDVTDVKYASKHFRRVIRFMNNQMVRQGFEVINAWAKTSSEKEYNRVLERTRVDSPLAAMEMCKKFGTDLAYIIWLRVKVKKTADNLYKAVASLDGEGYDSGGRDLGAGVYKTFIITKKDKNQAIEEAEKEVGDLVGRKLTAWSGTSQGAAYVAGGGGTAGGTPQGGVLARHAKELENLIEVRLDGATEYTISEIFGKIINTARGVVEARRMNSNIVPNNPQACYVTWQARIEDTDPFRLQSNIMKMAHDILDAGGETYYRGVPYRYTAAEVDLLKGLRPGEATSRRVQFVIDRELARDKEFQGRHDPYKAKEKVKKTP